jgi:hypothetical protein
MVGIGRTQRVPQTVRQPFMRMFQPLLYKQKITCKNNFCQLKFILRYRLTNFSPLSYEIN